MKYKVENLKGKVKISFTVTVEEWEKEMESAYQKNKGKYAFQGFRKGHVPRSVLEGAYGKDLFLEDAFSDAFPKYYGEVLDKHTEIFPVDRPDIDFESLDEKGLKFVATVVVKPEIELGKYKGLKIKKGNSTVTEEEVNGEIAKAQDKNARIVDVDRPVANGYEVTIDFSGSIDGVKFDGGTAQNQTLTVGSKTFIPGFEEQLIGMKKGESKDINVKFPDEYNAPELKGKDAVFAITLHDVKTKELPALDDEFAKDVSDFDTLKEYKDDIRKKLTEEKIKQAKIEEENALLDEVTKGCKVEVPNAMIETQIDSYIKEFEYSLMYQGLKIEDYLKYTGSTKEAMRDVYRERAKKAVETRLAMEAIVKAEDIKADAKSVDAKIKELAKQINQDYKEYKNTLSEEHLDYIKNEVLTDKLIEFLRAENTID